MNIQYVSKDYKITNKFKEILEKKLEKLNKYFSNNVDIKVNCTKQGDFDKLELTVSSEGTFVRSEVTSDNMYNNIDLALPKIEKQIVKASSRAKSRQIKDFASELEFLTELPVLDTSKVVRKKTFELVPLTIDDAKFNLEALGHSFYIFLNAETGKVNVLYKRNLGNLGLIEVDY